jgi:hypothetical protein
VASHAILGEGGGLAMVTKCLETKQLCQGQSRLSSSLKCQGTVERQVGVTKHSQGHKLAHILHSHLSFKEHIHFLEICDKHPFHSTMK